MMETLIYYHSTTKELWEQHIKREGLVPQPLNRARLEADGIAPFFDQIGLPLTALALWPKEVISRPLVEDFFLWQVCHTNTRSSVVLACRIHPEHTLSWRYSAHNKIGDSITVSHHQTIGADGANGRGPTFKTHDNVPLEWYVEPIPPKDLRVVFTVGLSIKKYSWLTPDRLPDRSVDYNEVYRQFSSRHVKWANDLMEKK